MRTRLVSFSIIVAAVVVLDQLTKFFARLYISPFETIQILPVLNLVNVHNEGAAFGMFSNLGNEFFIAVSVLAIIFIVWILVTGREDHQVLSLLAGGASGNLIDRISLGHVVDFIDVTIAGYHWPAFNVADSSLTIGVFLMFWNLLKKKP